MKISQCDPSIYCVVDDVGQNKYFGELNQILNFAVKENSFGKVSKYSLLEALCLDIHSPRIMDNIKAKYDLVPNIT